MFDAPLSPGLPLSPNLIALDSAQGQELLAGATAATGYGPLDAQFTAQATGSFCGVASAVMVLNALQGSSVSRFDQENVFSAGTETAVARKAIDQRGMSLDELGAFIRAQGPRTEVHHVADVDIDRFRREAIYRLGTPDHYVLVNYLRSSLEQKGGGHISPLGAYHAGVDRFLLLDVSRTKYPPVWVTTEALFAAMNTIVPANRNRSRGYVGVSR